MEQIKSIYSILFYWIKIQTKTEDVHVINFVDLVTRIPKHLDLYFSNFSTNFEAFSKFSLKTKGKELKTCIQAPRRFQILANMPLAGVRVRGGG